MLRFGRISSVDASKGLCKVSFGEDETVTDWLPTVHNGTRENSYFHTFQTEDHVAVMMNDNGITGVILGAIYSKNLQPSEGGEGKTSVVFDNGNKVVYDKATGSMELVASGGVKITGDVTVTGSIDASVDVKAGLLNTSLVGHTHDVVGVQAGAGTITSTPPL